MTDTIRHDAQNQRYELDLKGETAFIGYSRAGNQLILNTTQVPPPLEGRGIAARLTAHVLEEARREGLKIVPLCSYSAAYIRRHPDQADLLA
ncbi:GNAT family N-acetyltransferase [Brevundimonas sp.]|uniref:GNAT family N-acetyltransferase n=1 Tax=Brevundimonas sp. TaxID=1871086 RepID=UPI001E019AEC|nr:GNAT family N-acetyltransferase [Brevundimonas sp.]MBL0948363.1 N-acetyltransferase [Brevundimonas sp.]